MKWINMGEKVKLLASMMTSRLINSFRNPANLDYQNILCIKDDEIGDVCYSLHIFKMLKKQFPQSSITVLCKSYSAPLLKSDPSISKVVTGWKELQEKFDLIVDLQVSWKSVGYALQTWPKARLDRGTVRFADALQKRYTHEVETNYNVVAPVIRPVNRDKNPALTTTENDRKKAAEFIQSNNLSRFALLHISARKELKKWPKKNFASLAEYLHNHKGLQIVFTGSPDEDNDVREAMRMLSFSTATTTGKLSLMELAALMEKATIYIGNDSGPLHIACLMNVPSLGLYGPAPKDLFYPYGKKTAFIHHILPCNPCDQIHCIHPDNPCMHRITVSEVKEKVDELLS
jgi:ADP-heptose:LPS heptosyltransferase